MGTNDIAALPAEEALWLGAAFAHIQAFHHAQRIARIRRETQMALRIASRRAA